MPRKNNSANKTKAYSAAGKAAQKTKMYKNSSSHGKSVPAIPGVKVGEKLSLKNNIYTILNIISSEDATAEAVVYRVTDKNGIEFALKIYFEFPDLSNEPNSEALKRISRIKDPDILGLHSFGTGKDKYLGRFCYELSDFARGGDLLSITKKNFSKKYSIQFMTDEVIPQLFKGITNLHKHKIYHGDLKPSNMFYLDEEQQDLIIGDYGAATTFRQGSGKSISYESITRGTSFYLAPEQARGIISEKNDFYSMGMILLHLLYPELVTGDNLVKIIERQFSKKPIIDYNPAFDRINTLIAGLTLQDIDNRWGEEEVGNWLRHINPPVVYSTGFNAIRVGERVITRQQELVSYMDDASDWERILLEDSQGYEQLLSWFGSCRDLITKNKFEGMVNRLSFVNPAFAKTAVYRYFKPGQPLVINKHVFQLFDGKNLLRKVGQFLCELDQIWKKISLHKIRQYLLSLEISLLQLQQAAEGKFKKSIMLILEKICALVGSEATHDDIYAAGFSMNVTHTQLLHLFYGFNKQRSFRDIKGQEYSDEEAIGMLFIENPDLFNNKKCMLELQAYYAEYNQPETGKLEYELYLLHVFGKNLKIVYSISSIRQKKGMIDTHIVYFKKQLFLDLSGGSEKKLKRFQTDMRRIEKQIPSASALTPNDIYLSFRKELVEKCFIGDKSQFRRDCVTMQKVIIEYFSHVLHEYKKSPFFRSARFFLYGFAALLPLAAVAIIFAVKLSSETSDFLIKRLFTLYKIKLTDDLIFNNWQIVSGLKLFSIAAVFSIPGLFFAFFPFKSLFFNLRNKTMEDATVPMDIMGYAVLVLFLLLIFPYIIILNSLVLVSIVCFRKIKVFFNDQGLFAALLAQILLIINMLN